MLLLKLEKKYSKNMFEFKLEYYCFFILKITFDFIDHIPIISKLFGKTPD
jgi:hypothetical protein